MIAPSLPAAAIPSADELDAQYAAARAELLADNAAALAIARAEFEALEAKVEETAAWAARRAEAKLAIEHLVAFRAGVMRGR